jgi:hypothetical protein
LHTSSRRIHGQPRQGLGEILGRADLDASSVGKREQELLGVRTRLVLRRHLL